MIAEQKAPIPTSTLGNLPSRNLPSSVLGKSQDVRHLLSLVEFAANGHHARKRNWAGSIGRKHNYLSQVHSYGRNEKHSKAIGFRFESCFVRLISKLLDRNYCVVLQRCLDKPRALRSISFQSLEAEGHKGFEILITAK